MVNIDFNLSTAFLEHDAAKDASASNCQTHPSRLEHIYLESQRKNGSVECKNAFCVNGH